MAPQIIFTEQAGDTTYYCTTRRGVSYVAHQSSVDGSWFVSTRRLALGRWNTGGGRYYASLADLSRDCKAFAGLDALLSVEAVPA